MRPKLRVLDSCIAFNLTAAVLFTLMTFSPDAFGADSDAARALVDEAQANSQRNSLNSTHTIFRSELSLGLEFAQVQFNTSSASGIGIGLAYQYAFAPRWAIRPQISQVLSVSGDGYLYTAFGGFVTYAVRGGYIWGQTETSFNGRLISSVSTPRQPTISVGAGFEQLFLNGTQNVFAAPGLALTGSSTQKFGSRWFTLGAKFGQYKSSNLPVTGIVLNVSLPWSL